MIKKSTFSLSVADRAQSVLRRMRDKASEAYVAKRAPQLPSEICKEDIASEFISVHQSYAKWLMAEFTEGRLTFNPVDCLAYHILVNSGPVLSRLTRIDFPGKNSVAAWLRKVISGDKYYMPPNAFIFFSAEEHYLEEKRNQKAAADVAWLMGTMGGSSAPAPGLPQEVGHRKPGRASEARL